MVLAFGEIMANARDRLSLSGEDMVVPVTHKEFRILKERGGPVRDVEGTVYVDVPDPILGKISFVHRCGENCPELESQFIFWR